MLLSPIALETFTVYQRPFSSTPPPIPLTFETDLTVFRNRVGGVYSPLTPRSVSFMPLRGFNFRQCKWYQAQIPEPFISHGFVLYGKLAHIRALYPFPVRVLQTSSWTSFIHILTDADLSSTIRFHLTGSLETYTQDNVSCPAYQKSRHPLGQRLLFMVSASHAQA